MGDTECVITTKPLKQPNCEFTMTVGKHTATVVAKNKREGKHRAAQSILQKLHPHIHFWGSILRLYGKAPKLDELKEAEEKVSSLCLNSELSVY